MKAGITIKSAEYVGGYKISITFSDGHVNVFDYEKLVMRNSDECVPYRPLHKFKKFHVTSYGSIGWGKSDYMILHTNYLYHKKEFKSIHKQVGKRMVKGKDYVVIRELPEKKGIALYHWMAYHKHKFVEDAEGVLCAKKEHYDLWIGK